MKIGTTSFLNSSSSSSSARQLRGFKVSVQESENSSAVRAETSSPRISKGASLQASQATSAARIASSAASSILEARKSQEDLIEKASISNDPARRQEFQDAIDELDTEIQRIKTEATDETGANVLEGKTLEISDEEIVALADLSSIADSSGVDVVSNPDGAESSFAEVLNIAVSGVESASSATRKAEQVLSETTAVEAETRASEGAITAEDEATELSETIATELQTTLNTASSDLEADSVLQLISD